MRILVIAFAFWGLGHIATALAAERGVSGNVSVLTDYADAGVSMTDESPALQGDIRFTSDGGLFAELFGTNVDFNDSNEATVELKPSLGYRFSIEEFDVEFGTTYILYTGASEDLDYDFWEAFLVIGRSFGSLETSLTVNHTPNDSGDAGPTTAVESDSSYPVYESQNGRYQVLLNVYTGYHSFDDSEDYFEYAFGAAVAFDAFEIFVSAHWNQISDPECGDVCASRMIAGVSYAF